MTEDKTKRKEIYFIVPIMFIYTFLMYGKIDNNTGTLIIALMSTLTYFLAIYLFYGIAYMAYSKHTYLLWGSGVAAFVVGYLMTGLSEIWTLLMSWSMILFAGAIIGRLTLTGKSYQKIYLIGLLAVSVFSLGLFSPIWHDLLITATQKSTEMINEVRQSLQAMGYSADAIRESTDSTIKMFHALIRLIPALMILSVVVQFSLGFIIFIYRINKNNLQTQKLAPFIHWKIPFGVTPLLMVAILLRIFGSATYALVADNVIAFLAFFYAITGLALMEFYLEKFNFSKFMRVLFYVMFFFTQLIGLFVAALIGFIDSFADWRKSQPLNLAKE
ncbi:MAG: DUF2232 domain-containing protein [FCB group bacterium]|nr:DUF2232 domain-containing protein [FCB group bacterium]